MAVVGVGVAVVGVAFDHDKRLNDYAGTRCSPLCAGRRTGGGKRGVIFDPFLSPRNMICFGTQQVVFSVTRNIFRNAKQLARKGKESSSEVVAFYRAPHVPRPDFNRRRVSGTLRSKMGALEGIIASYEQKKRSSL